jgi:hypothetical protein
MLHHHSIVRKLDADLIDADLMGTYCTIPCSTFHSELCSMDKERCDNAWDVKKVLAEALVKYNDIHTNEEWIMDVMEQEPPVNPLALPAYQKGDKPYAHKHTKDLPKGGKPSNGIIKTKNWKYIGPKEGKFKTKWITTADGKKEKCLWCDTVQCHCGP